MHEERAFALRIARQAGEILVEHWGRLDPAAIELKRAHDPVTVADRASEEFLVREIHHRWPGDGILAEEAARERLEAERVWLLDPLDGTINYTHSHPFVAVSVALAVRGRVEAAAVCAPMLGESWSASRGGGATRHLASGAELPCRVSRTAQPGEALLATGFPYVRHVSPFNNLAPFQRLFFLVRGIRRCGTASIDLAHVASGVYDGFWEGHLECFDVAAGSLLVEEAGGRVTDYQCGGAWLYGKNIVATNGRIHDFLLGQVDRDFDPDARK